MGDLLFSVFQWGVQEARISPTAGWARAYSAEQALMSEC